MDTFQFFNSGAQFTMDKNLNKNPEPKTNNNNNSAAAAAATAADHFAVDDLLDFSADDAAAGIVTPADAINDSSPVTAVESCNSTSFSGSDQHFAADVGRRNLFDTQFSADLGLPQYDDHVEELEWLSSFVEESFSSEDLQKLHLISGIKARPENDSESDHHHVNPVAILPEPAAPVPGKARSKRSRAAPGDWTSRLMVLSEPEPSAVTNGVLVGLGKKSVKGGKKREGENHNNGGGGGGGGSDGRKCLHCATDKTPQWRTGPMGPKTLCNACGVRYKSGRLVPEYRPAASPTFMLTKHSNSHRKVMELRRQKEVNRSIHHQHHQHEQHHHHHHQQQRQQAQMMIHQHQGMIYDIPNGDDYLIHQTVGHDYRQMI